MPFTCKTEETLVVLLISLSIYRRVAEQYRA